MKVSIIIPTYNRPVFLAEALASILAQSYQNIEIVVVNDGSTDNTVEQFDSLVAGLPPSAAAKIKFLSQKNSGAPTARNLGFEASSGSGVIFMDSDDLLSPDGLAEGVRALEELEVGFVYMPVQKCDESGSLIDGAHVGSPFENHPAEIVGYHWQTMGAIYLRKTVEKVGPWNPDLTGSQDWEYQARVKMSGAKGKFVDSIIGYWRIHGRSRIGTSAYNHRYVLSVEKACIAIGAEASEKGLLDRGLSSKLLNRLIIHAIEAGAAGASADRNRILYAARQFAKGMNVPLLVLSRMVNFQILDRSILARFRRIVLSRKKRTINFPI